MKIRIRQSHSVRFYYPDLSVVCQPNPDEALFQDQPVVVAEVLSDTTRRVDEFEKREDYEGLEAVIFLSEIGCQLSLPEVYANVLFRTTRF